MKMERQYAFLITDGSMHDSTQAKSLLHSAIHKGVYVLGDRAYDSDEIVNYITENNAIAVIPPRKNRKEKREYEKEIYKNRNQIERFFNRLKQFRRIATRYDKLVSSFLSLVQLATILIILPKFSSSVDSILVTSTIKFYESKSMSRFMCQIIYMLIYYYY